MAAMVGGTWRAEHGGRKPSGPIAFNQTINDSLADDIGASGTHSAYPLRFYRNGIQNSTYKGQTPMYAKYYEFKAYAGQKIAITLTVSSDFCSTNALAELGLNEYPDWTCDLTGGFKLGIGTHRFPESGYFTVPETREYFIRVNNDVSNDYFTSVWTKKYTLKLETPPISGATVSFIKTGGESTATAPAPVTTDANGCWSAVFPNGNSYQAVFQKDGYYFDNKNFSAQDFPNSASTMMTEAHPQCGLVIASPNEGNVWLSNKSYNITWGYGGDPGQQVEINLLKDGTKIANITTTTAGSGSYPWIPPSTLQVGTGYQIQIKNLKLSTVSLSGAFSIGVGGKVKVSDHMLAGDKIPVSKLSLSPLQSSNSGTAFQVGDWSKSAAKMLDTQLFSIDMLASNGYYFQGKAGQVLELSGGMTGKSTIKSFAIVQTDASGNETIKAHTPLTKSDSTQNWTYTIPADGVYMVVPYLRYSPSDGQIISWSFSVAIGISGVTMTVTPQSGTEQPYTVTTNMYGEWQMVPKDSTSYSVVLSSDDGYAFSPDKLTVDTKNTSYLNLAEENAINVSAPAKGAKAYQGAGMDITWNYYVNPGSTVNIDLLKAGVVVKNIATGAAIGTGGSGSYHWNIPQDMASGSDYSIRVTSVQNGVISSVSNLFSIGNPLAVTAPAGGSSWAKSLTKKITWTYGGADIGDKVKIELLKGGTAVTISDSCAAGTSGAGSFDWTLPSDLTEGTDYQVRVTSLTYPDITVDSAKFIVAGTFTVSGNVNVEYNGSASTVTATNMIQSYRVAGSSVPRQYITPVAVPVSLGETVHGTIDATDAQLQAYKSEGYYFDEYQLVMDASQPFAVEAAMDDGSTARVRVVADFSYPDSDGNAYYSYAVSSCQEGNGSTQLVPNRFPQGSGYWAIKDYGLQYLSSGVHSVRVQIFSKTKGAYTVKFLGPLMGAAVSFKTTDGTAAVPPAAVIINSSKPWTASLTSGSAYEASAAKDGYTITPETASFDGPKDNLNFTAVSNSVPEIKDLALDKSSVIFDYGHNNTLIATIHTKNAPDGMPVLIRLVNLQGGMGIAPMDHFDNIDSGDDSCVSAGGTITGNSAQITLHITSNERSYNAIPAGLYQACAQIGGSSVTVSKPFAILDAGNSAQVQSAEMTPNIKYDRQPQAVAISVKTLNVPDNTKISAVLTDCQGNRYSPEYSVTGNLVTGNKANFSMNIPQALTAGSYNIQLTINTPVPLVVDLPFTVKPYTVTFKNYDGRTVKLAQAGYEKTAEAPENPSRTGYTFTGWDKSFDKVTANMTVTAQYQINSYKVSFNTAEGSAVSSQTVNYNTKATKPEDPKKDNCIFAGWCSDEALSQEFDFNTAIKGDTVIYAKWTPVDATTYTVTFKDWNGTILKSDKVEAGKGAAAPTLSKREGYNFTGWDVDFSNVTSELTVTAQYQIISYTVHFEVNGGSAVENQTVKYNEKAVKPTKDPTKDGAVFAGWYSDEALTTEFDFTTPIKDTTGIYAKWTTIVNVAAIPGVTAPVRGAAPVIAITDTDQYTGTVKWSPTIDSKFAPSTAYTATIELEPKTGYTLTGVAANLFTVAGATSVTNDANTGIITAVFPATAAAPVTDTVISIADIDGLTAPARGETPVTSITETTQYTGAVEWTPTVNSKFAPSTSYTATIKLTPKTGYTLTGVAANFFKVSGATSVRNDADLGVITAAFPATAAAPVTDTVISIAAIDGVAAPVRGVTPVSTITATNQYTGSVIWSPTVNGTFAPSTAYTATITLYPNSGYTLAGVAANFFTVAGATSVSNSADYGVITAVFPATEAEPDTAINLAAISGVTAPVRGATPVTSITGTDQYTGTVSWSPNASTFAARTGYTATITLTPKAGYTLAGVAADFFTVDGATSVSNSADSGIITAVFSATAAAPDTIKPTVTSVTPSGTGTAINGNIAITFSEAMDTTAGTVSLNGGTSLTGGTWSVGNTVYTIPYSTLANSTAYIATIFGFKDASGNVMETNNSHSFTTSGSSGGSGGTSSGGSSSGGSTSTTENNSSITVTTDAGTTTAAQTVSATTESNGVAAASVTKAQITDMMKAASEKAQAQNTQTALEIKVDSGSAAAGVSVTILQGAASSLKDGINALTISSPVVSVTFDDKALAEINKDTTGDITVTARKPADTALSEKDKAIIGSRPVYDLKVISGSTTISTFGGGTATVSVPYTPTTGEDTSKIVVYYISGSGKLVIVPGCVYDASTGTVTFKTTHFSSYAVGYNNVSFTDVSGWYADYVNYLAARGIINGTGDGKFSPDANITRAEFVTILANLSGNDLSTYTSSAFSDVSTSDWYSAAVQWANKNGIASGYNGAFDPNANITREQMAVMLFNYAKCAGINVSDVEGMSVREFSDYVSISNWALAPIQWAINEKIVSGNSDGSFAPTANATRSQAAKMIALLLQCTVK